MDRSRLPTVENIPILLLLLLLAACASQANDLNDVDRVAVFERLVAPHPVAGRDDPGLAVVQALDGCVLLEAGHGLDRTVELLWWDDHEPWPKPTIRWVVSVGVLVFCPEHSGLLVDVDGPTR